jgi:hypothetical protein
VKIDERIADLIAGLWERGVQTTAQSCEEYRNGVVWIAFRDAAEALAFLAALGISESDLLKGPDGELDEKVLAYRALSPEVASHSSSFPSHWRWSAQPYPGANAMGIAVEFPCEDLPELMRRLSGEST